MHFKSRRLPEDWTTFRTDVVHNNPDNKGWKLDYTSDLLAVLVDGFDHVGNIVSPSVDPAVGGDRVDSLQHF